MTWTNADQDVRRYIVSLGLGDVIIKYHGLEFWSYYSHGEY